VSGLGPSFMKIWTCGSSPRSGSRNVLTRIKNINGASRLSKYWNFFIRRYPNDFLSQLMAMDETWLYHNDPETKNNQWSGGIVAYPAPKNYECKNPLENFSPASIFWDQDGILLIDHLPKGQTINAEYYSSLLVQLNDILKENATPQEGHQGCLVLAQQCSGSPGTSNPEETDLPRLSVS